MAKVKKAKTRKPSRAKKARKASKKAAPPKPAPPKPARSGGTHVDFGVHGLGKIMTAIQNAGLGDQLNAHLASSGQFVKVHRKSLAAIKHFVKERPQLANLAQTIGECDCPPDDPGCVYIPG
ncbi:hypothetical protein QA639_34545 [Bradyrhizobium pachyrhizi]|uniref:hypothetical protein n=1 Tax=Bradyrhizobium TaxID=374 RepID=UPI0024B20589|nr:MULTISPECIES: hypothetical protein [Bradyrhizobium]WFU54666.1 hypothetical protein QA639_34545 [Bradyrhizobium pachyrhizi]WOH80487.1 hypothetical protein RX327_32685 [Bradyrhizobium sp. BEA-2-5]